MDNRRIFDIEARRAASTGATLRRVWGYLSGRRLLIILVLITAAANAWSLVKVPDVIGQVVDCYLVPDKDNLCRYEENPESLSRADRIEGIRERLIVLVGLFLLNALTTAIMFYAMRWAGLHMLRDLRVEIFKQSHRLSLSYYAENEAGDIMSRFTNDIDTLQQALSFALVQVVRGALLVVWLVYAMLSRNVLFALISLSMVPFMLLITLWFSSQARRAFRRARREIGDVSADLQENIAAVRETQAFAREAETIARFRHSNAANRDANIQAVAYTSALAPALEALGYVAIVLTATVGGLLILRDERLGGSVVSLGLIFTFIAYIQQFNQPIQMIATLWTNIQSAVAGSERIFDFLDIVPQVLDKPGAIEMPPIVGHVELRDVWMHYKEGEPVLRGVSMAAQPGQMIALVGPTGAGKSSIINLLPRFYDVTGGAVLIDGLDVRDVTQHSLRRQIGIVQQETFLFSDTVLNNIRYGRPDATREEVIEAAKLAHADGFTSGLPLGYETLLGERGSGLSQGQRQLLAIARAALANPRLLILDEATSSVDTRTERLIQQALEGLLKGRTSFVIAHRLSTIRSADQVYVIDQGRVVEHGTHDQLLAAQGFYYGLYTSQFRREAL